MDTSAFVAACLEAAKEIKPQIRGMIVSEARWDEILENAQLVTPTADGLMEFSGLKVRVSPYVPDHFIVWTDNQGKTLHVQDLREPEHARRGKCLVEL